MKSKEIDDEDVMALEVDGEAVVVVVANELKLATGSAGDVLVILRHGESGMNMATVMSRSEAVDMGRRLVESFGEPRDPELLM